jgi:hypothetical protein
MENDRIPTTHYLYAEYHKALAAMSTRFHLMQAFGQDFKKSS